MAEAGKILNKELALDKFFSLNSINRNSQNPLPLVVEPKNDAQVQTLVQQITDLHESINNKITEHGALLFRNFEINSARDFEDVARAVDPDLKNDYLGTSPRNKVTDYTFSASELPPYYPIMQHCEMSFLPHPPRKLFFYCETAPKEGGETPITDFRKVYKDLDPEIRSEFEKKGIRNIRNYNGPTSRSRFDLWKLKRWDEMFLTTDKQQVEKSCVENGLQYEWFDNDKLRLVNDQQAVKDHPQTGEPVWFNHLQVFHYAVAAMEYKKIHQRQRNWRSLFFNNFISLVTNVKRYTVKPEEQAMHCIFADGSEIPLKYVQHLQDVIWKNMSFFKWQKGDVLAIDNFSTSHGRMPYSGSRVILVSWSA